MQVRQAKIKTKKNQKKAGVKSAAAAPGRGYLSFQSQSIAILRFGSPPCPRAAVVLH